VACTKSRLDARGEEALARRHLRPGPGDDADARQHEYRADVSVSRGQVLAPSVATRAWPGIPEALQRKYAERQVVISAVVEKDRKVSHVAILRMPDPWFSTPVARALAKWVFHPAQVNSAPVSVKSAHRIPL
jgi:hypothetical protein